MESGVCVCGGEAGPFTFTTVQMQYILHNLASSLSYFEIFLTIYLILKFCRSQMMHVNLIAQSTKEQKINVGQKKKRFSLSSTKRQKL